MPSTSANPDQQAGKFANVPLNWTYIPTADGESAPQSMCCQTMCQYKRELVVFGGGIIGTTFGNMWRFNIDTRKWTEVVTGGRAPPPRLSHAACVLDDKLYIHGGLSMHRTYADLWAFDFLTDTWSRISVPSEPEVPRRGHQLAPHGGKIYMFMGFSTKNLRDVWCFNPVDQTWTEIQSPSAITPGAPVCGLSGYASCIEGDNFYTFGGIEEPNPPIRYCNKVYRFNFVSRTWSEYLFPASPSPHPRYASIMWAQGNTVYIHGGDSESCSLYFDDCWAIDVTSPITRWRELDQVGDVPCARSGHTGVVVDAKLYTFGGECRAEGSASDVTYSGCVFITPVGLPVAVPLKDLASRWVAQALATRRMFDVDLDGLNGVCFESVASLAVRHAKEELKNRTTVSDW